MQTDIEQEIKEAVAACDLLLYGVEKSGDTVSIYIQTEGENSSASIQDCEAVMKQLSYSADVDDLHIEVSSTGESRPLLTPEHFDSAIDKKIKIRTHGKSFVGTLLSTTASHVTLQCKDGEESIAHTDIKKARIIPIQTGEKA